MGKIVAIGGGEIGRPGKKKETVSIDREIIRLTAKKHPKLLFIPTASEDSSSYISVVQKYFGNYLGCTIDTLLLIKEKPTRGEIRTKILENDIIYVGGGNTLRMMKIWRKMGVDKVLQLAYKKGIVLAGVSAGAICWFRYGNSDSRQFKKPTAPLIKVRGLNLFPFLLCPHYLQEKGRVASLKNMMNKTKEMSIALDNCSALEIVDNTFRILTSNKKSKAYKVYWKDGIYHQEPLKNEYAFVSALLTQK